MGTIRYISQPAREGDFTHGRNGHTIQSIILHSSCGDEDGDLLTLTGHDPGHLVSSHWYITKDGRIFHLVDNANTAYHAGVVTDPMYSNSCSIGIEQEHYDPDDAHPGGEAWPDVQVQAAARLIVALRQRYGDLPVKSHADIAAPHGRKTDPWAYPWGNLHVFAEVAKQQEWGFAEVSS